MSDERLPAKEAVQRLARGKSSEFCAAVAKGLRAGWQSLDEWEREATIEWERQANRRSARSAPPAAPLPAGEG